MGTIATSANKAEKTMKQGPPSLLAVTTKTLTDKHDDDIDKPLDVTEDTTPTSTGSSNATTFAPSPEDKAAVSPITLTPPSKDTIIVDGKEETTAEEITSTVASASEVCVDASFYSARAVVGSPSPSASPSSTGSSDASSSDVVERTLDAIPERKDADLQDLAGCAGAKMIKMDETIDEAEAKKLTTAKYGDEDFDASFADNGSNNRIESIPIAFQDQLRHITLVRSKDVAVSSNELEDLLKVAFGLGMGQKIVGFAATKTGAEGADGIVFVTLSAVANGKLDDESITNFELLVLDRHPTPKSKASPGKSPLTKALLQHRPNMLSSSYASFGADLEGLEDYQDDGDLNMGLFNTTSYFTDNEDSLRASIDGGKLSISDLLDVISVLVEGGDLDLKTARVITTYAEQEIVIGDGSGDIKGPLKVAFCLAEWAANSSLLTDALRSLSDTILKDQANEDALDISSVAGHLSMSSMDFLLEVSEAVYHEARKEPGEELSTGQLWALQHAIITGHPSIAAIHQAYRKKLELSYMKFEDDGAAMEDDGIQGALEFLIHALGRVATSLDPIRDCELEASVEDLNELDSFGAILEACVCEMDEDAQKMAYEMLLDRDHDLLNSLRAFLVDGDCDKLHNDVIDQLDLRKEFLDYEDDEEDVEEDPEIPNILIAAYATLVDHNRVTQKEAYEIVAAYRDGVSTLNFILEYAKSTGDMTTFLQQCEFFCNDDGFGFTGDGRPYDDALATAMLGTFYNHIDLPSETGGDGGIDIHGVLDEAIACLTSLEIQAVKLAVVREDPLLDEAMLQFFETRDISSFQAALLMVANDTLAETRMKMPGL